MTHSAPPSHPAPPRHRSPPRRAVTALLLLSLAASLALPACSAWRQRLRADFPTLDSQQIDRLISTDSSSGIFPASWRQAPFHGKATPIPDHHEQRARQAVARALGRYPAPLIRSNLHRVYLLGGLQFFRDQSFGGTASARAVYLVAGDPADGYTDTFIERTFHRELSTLLLNRYRDKLDTNAWRAVNPPDFSYRGGNSWDRTRGKDGGARAIDAGETSLALGQPPENLNDGFLTEYSRSSLENDFNEYAALLFAGDREFWRAVDRHPAVARKCDLAIAFYQSLSPELTRDYFRHLAGL